MSTSSVLLHAYSGRRRPGDFQWYIDAMTAAGKLDGVYVVSLDIVIDSTWGDIGQDATQDFWLSAIARGQVLGMLSGPPCCTWSVARGKQGPTLPAHRRGPRVLRDVAHLWGYHSVSLREMYQLMDGHLLLGFSMKAMVLLSLVGASGALEHPALPDDPAAASIWRLPLMKLIISLPGFELLVCAQGLLGADSAKRTGLLALNLPGMPLHIRANAVCPHIPKGQSIGLDSQGQFRTAKLKEYPPAFCKALAEGFFSQLPSDKDLEKSPSLPHDFLHRCKAMTCTNMGQAIGADHVRK